MFPRALQLVILTNSYDSNNILVEVFIHPPPTPALPLPLTPLPRDVLPAPHNLTRTRSRWSALRRERWGKTPWVIQCIRPPTRRALYMDCITTTPKGVISKAPTTAYPTGDEADFHCVNLQLLEQTSSSADSLTMRLLRCGRWEWIRTGSLQVRTILSPTTACGSLTTLARRHANQVRQL
jgi:hypothetical protein